MDWAVPLALEPLAMSLVCPIEGIGCWAASGAGFKEPSPSSCASPRHQARGGSDGTTCVSPAQHTPVPAQGGLVPSDVHDVSRNSSAPWVLLPD